MNKEDLITYAEQLANQSPLKSEIDSEVDFTILLLLVYRCGLLHKDFPLSEFLGEKIDFDKVIPLPWHTLISQLALLKSSNPNPDTRDYLTRNSKKLLETFRNFFIPKL